MDQDEIVVGPGPMAANTALSVSGPGISAQTIEPPTRHATIIIAMIIAFLFIIFFLSVFYIDTTNTEQ